MVLASDSNPSSTIILLVVRAALVVPSVPLILKVLVVLSVGIVDDEPRNDDD